MKTTLAVTASLLLAFQAAAQIPANGVIGPGQMVTIGAGQEVRHSGPIFVAGGRLLVNGGTLVLNGSMMVTQEGRVEFDGGEFHHEGEDTHVSVGALDPAQGAGSFVMRNGSRLRWVQSYVSQHELQARNGGRIELERTRVDCDAATGVIRLFDTASFSAFMTSATKEDGFSGCWSTWYLSDDSHLKLDSVKTAGDIVFYDRARIEVYDTLGVMPWLYFPRGSSADLSFPPAPCDATHCPAVSKTIDAHSAGVSGIGWSVEIRDSRSVAWGFNSYPGSRVVVRDSALTMAMVRMAEDNVYVVPGEFRNNSSYDDKTFASLYDRHLQLIRSSVQWWKLDVIDSAQARLDRVTFAEMVTKNTARALLTNSICEGQTIHLGALNDSYLYFKDGEVWTHVSAWNQAFLVLDGSLVDWTLGQYPYQSRNIAHNRERIYALNSHLLSPLEAMESALATFARLGTFEQKQLQTAARTWTPVDGSAWIAAGPASRVRFDRWILALRAPNATGWTEIAQGDSEVRDARLTTIWPGYLWQPGEYELRLSIVVRGDDPATPYPTWAFPAVKKLVVK